MAMTINTDSLAKLDAMFNYAKSAFQSERTAGDTVIRIDGKELTCQVSKADAPKSWFGLFRSRNKDQQELNNATRALFKQTVFDALGIKDESELPKSVKSAMKLSNYHNKGRPLTARRIISVVNAIRNSPEIVVSAAIPKCLARNETVRATVDKGISKLEVTPQMRTDAQELVAKYGRGFKPKALQVFANYTLFTLANPATAERADEILDLLAKFLSKFDDFEFGDTRFEPLNTKLGEVYQDKLDFYKVPEHADYEYSGDGHVANTMIGDAFRAHYKINGADPSTGLAKKEDVAKSVVDQFKKEVPEKFQRPLSLFMSQKMSRILNELLLRQLVMTSTGDLVEGSGHKGSELLPFSPQDGDCFIDMGGLISSANNITYRLDVSADKKHATVTIENSYNLLFAANDAFRDSLNVCGAVKLCEKFDFDLTGETLKITNHQTSQHIEA